MECGEQIEVTNVYGAVDMRFIAQCGGRFMTITNTGDFRNGYMLADWRAVMRELITHSVPAKMIDRQKLARSANSGPYIAFPLTYPLSAQNFANILGVPVEDIRAELADLAVTTDGSLR